MSTCSASWSPIRASSPSPRCISTPPCSPSSASWSRSPRPMRSLDHEAIWRALDHEAAARPRAHQRHPGAAFIGCHACDLLNHALPGTAMPALPRHAAPAQTQQHQPQLGAPECRSPALHPGQYLPGHDHHRARPHLSLHHHGRHRRTGGRRPLAARIAGLLRQHHHSAA